MHFRTRWYLDITYISFYNTATRGSREWEFEPDALIEYDAARNVEFQKLLISYASIIILAQ